MAPLIGEIYPTKLLFICKEFFQPSCFFICKEFFQPSCCSYARNFSRNPGQIKNRTVQGGSCKTNIAVSLDVISERGGWILHFTLHVTCYTPHVAPTLHDVTLCAWRYLLHVTPPILHTSERGARLPHVTLRYTPPSLQIVQLTRPGSSRY